MRGPLAPTVITDRNGKVTTVHRRSDSSRAAAGASLPAPTLPTGSASAGTPLREPEPLTDREREAVAASLYAGNWDIELKRMLSRISDRNLALLKRISDNHPQYPGLIGNTFYHLGGGLRASEVRSGNLLLIIERIMERNHLGLDDSELKMGAKDAVTGLGQTDHYLREPKPITTEEELESTAALVAFLIRHEALFDDEVIRTVLVTTPVTQRSKIEYPRLRNPYLEELIRERPGDVEAISAYVRSRGMHRRNKGPVLALRSFLDDVGAPAVGDGWL